MQPCNPNAKLETKCLHAGYTPKNGGPGTVPIVQSTTYRFDSTEKVAELFDMPMEPMYSRFANPTCDAVEQKIAALEGGVGAMLTSSGQAASLLSVLNLCSAGDSIVSVSTIYGGTVNLFGVTLKRFGIECIWVDPLADEETISQAIQPNTKLIFGETIANPALTVFDIEKFADRGQHLCYPDPLPSHRVRCGYRHPLHHQVHGRSCAPVRRRDRGRRHIRLGKERQVPGFH